MSQPAERPDPAEFGAAALECDVVMKGGITSGVIYPHALTEFAKVYRFRGVGGTSAGAIGAACAAAAEFGRESGGFIRLHKLPEQLGGGKLAQMFQPQASTKQLLPVLMAATGHSKPGSGASNRLIGVPTSLIRGFPITAGMTVLAAAAFALVGAKLGGGMGVLLAIPGVLLAAILGGSALVGRVYWKLTHSVPRNLLGICRGLSTENGKEGFTDWLSGTIDNLAGIGGSQGPLTFGQLWGGTSVDPETDATQRNIDLRMITTCISRSRPYELPWDSRNFFYDPTEWRTLFPAYVMEALEAQPADPPAASMSIEDRKPTTRWEWETFMATRHNPPLRRLPGPRELPVIVATRMSLSFPLLISAIPLWSINYRSERTTRSLDHWTKSGIDAASDEQPDFEMLWFTDGGMCSNFPVHMFDSPLPVRPTFAINLGKFSDGQTPRDDQRENVEIAKTNSEGLLPSYRKIEAAGFKAVSGFAGAALDTIRNWQDNAYLDAPGHRDRIVRVLQTKDEGGLNLFMESPTITELAERGKAAASELVGQFNQNRYKTEEVPTRTGWENHLWIRYRALMASLPDFVSGYARGKAVLDTDIDPSDTPSYSMTAAERKVAADVSTAIEQAATAVKDAKPAVSKLTKSPARAGVLRRRPRM